MKYNRILEAITRGIQIALDDYQDIENSNSISSYNDVINSENNIKNLIEFKKYFVDLGLPSGTIWAKYNLGVDSNKLSKPKDWYGDYYAWGEIKSNKTDKYGNIHFGWDNYKFGIGLNKLTKYCNIPENGLNGFTDNLIQLLPEDNAAYQTKKLHNFKFYIPTKEQCEELINYTSNYWVKNYDPNNMVHHANDDGIKGLNGRVFIGKNGNQLFIPAAGYCGSLDFDAVGSCCYLWSSSLYLKYSNNAYYLDFDSDFINISDSERCDGHSIRPVM